MKEDGPVGPYHRKVESTIDSVLNLAAHLKLECGHTVVIFNLDEWRADHPHGLVYCAECADKSA